MSNIQEGLTAYETEYGVPIKTGNNASIIKILSGDNPRKMEFLSFNPSDRGKQSEALDAWRTPFLINLTDPLHPKILSAGPDRKWGTVDDMSTDDGPR